MKNYIVIALILVNLFSLSAKSFAFSTKNKLNETIGLVTAGDKPVILLGGQVEVGQPAPNFKVVDENFNPVALTDFRDQVILISVVPSLDTGVCSLQTKRFNEEVANLPETVVMLTISNDLPFAQRRFCQAEKVDQLTVLSDSVWRNFGENYGLLIKDMGLLTRAIFIIDAQGKVHYKELVANVSSHPDYDTALATLSQLIKVDSEATASKATDQN